MNYTSSKLGRSAFAVSLATFSLALPAAAFGAQVSVGEQDGVTVTTNAKASGKKITLSTGTKGGDASAVRYLVTYTDAATKEERTFKAAAKASGGDFMRSVAQKFRKDGAMVDRGSWKKWGITTIATVDGKEISAVNEGFEAKTDADINDTVGTATDAAKDATGAVTDAAGDATGAVTDAAGEVGGAITGALDTDGKKSKWWWLIPLIALLGLGALLASLAGRKKKANVNVAADRTRRGGVDVDVNRRDVDVNRRSVGVDVDNDGRVDYTRTTGEPVQKESLAERVVDAVEDKIDDLKK